MKRHGKALFRWISATLLLAVLAGCAPEDDRKLVPPLPPPATSVDQRAVDAANGLGFRLFAGRRAADGPAKNLFISPTSISMALSLTMNGAEGATRAAMAETLGVAGLSADEVNGANAALRTLLTNPDPKVRLQVANAIWYRKGLSLGKEFAVTSHTFYGAEIQALDFDRKDAPATINKWVSKATEGKIESIIDQIEPATVMHLINAIYFNGTWTEPFDERRTENRSFYRPDGTVKAHPLMATGGRLRYLKGDAFQAVSLPYGAGRFSLYVFLPDKDSSLEAFCEGLTAERWTEWMAQFAEQSGSVALPRVKLEYKTKLAEDLKALGMGLAFGPGADFSRMFESKSPTWIDQVTHKTYLDINERGTEAAAVTDVGAAGASRPKDPFSMVVDHPFFIAIRDNQTGVILFMGAITDP